MPADQLALLPFDLDARLRLVSEAAEDGISAMAAADEIRAEFERLRAALVEAGRA